MTMGGGDHLLLLAVTRLLQRFRFSLRSAITVIGWLLPELACQNVLYMIANSPLIEAMMLGHGKFSLSGSIVSIGHDRHYMKTFLDFLHEEAGDKDHCSLMLMTVIDH